MAHVGAAVAKAARAFEADLVVVGSRGLSDWRSLFEHGVSNQVLTAVSRPVLVVRGRLWFPFFTPSRVMLAIAGGDDVEPAIRAATAAASTPGSKVLVTHIVQSVIDSQGDVYVESEERSRPRLSRRRACSRRRA
jgi:nucleotide-binding universal stress UspA family protein